MVIKHKRILKNKSINKVILRFKPGGFSPYTVFQLIIVKKKSRAQNGKYLDRIGVFNPNFNERYLFFDSTKLYFWVEHGIIVHYKVKNILLKFLINNSNNK